MVRNLGMGGLVGALIRHPRLWSEGIRLFRSVRRRGRPWPSAAYLAWRSHTAYSQVVPVPADDFVAYLEWRRLMREWR